MHLTNHAEQKLADMLRGQGLAPPTNWYLQLGTAASDSSFTQIAAIARATVPRTLLKWSGTQAAGSTVASVGSSCETSNNDAISWTNPGTTTGTATHVGFFDNSTGGNCWFWVPITSIAITTTTPDPITIAAGALRLVFGLAGGMSRYLANKLIDLIWRGQAYTYPATVHFAAYTSPTTAAGGGTEVSAAGYARKSFVGSLSSLCGTQGAGTTAASSGSSGRTATNAALAYGAPTADWGTVTHEGVRDASTGGNLLWHAELGTPVTIVAGGPALTHAADEVEFTFA